MKFYFFLLSCFISNHCLFSQNETNDNKTIYNTHEIEVGIDVKKFVNSILTNSFEEISSLSINPALILKIRAGEKRFISINEKRAFRILADAIYLQPFINEDSLIASSNQISNTFSEALNEKLKLSLLLGYEWQKQNGKYQYFNGFDLGVEYDNSVRSLFINTGNPNFRKIKDKRLLFPFIGFAGFKYFLSPKVSFSFESSFELRYIRVFNQTIESLPIPVEVDEFSVNKIQLNFNFLRNVNFSYYF